MPKFIVKRQDAIVDEFELESGRETYSLGSDEDNDFVITHKKISPKHLRIEQQSGNFYLEDLKSAFGTTLNGRPLLGRVQVVDGDELNVGNVTLVFENHGAPRPPKPVVQDEEDLEVIDEFYLQNLTGPSSLSNNASPELNSFPADRHSSAPDSKPESFYEVEALDPFAPEEEPETGPVAHEVVREPEKTTRSSYQLIAIYGPYMGRQYPLKLEDNKIGRDNTLNDIVIRNNEDGVLDPSISRRHATLSYRQGRFHVSDKRSKTRTYVNQIKLSPTDEIALEDGDEIEIVSDQKSTIFRLVSSSIADSSPPKKAGIWWIRNNLRLGMFITALLGAVALGMVVFSFVQRLAINKKPESLKFIEETWYQSDALDDSPTTIPDYLSSIGISDLNNDKSVDIIFTNRSGKLSAVDGTTKEVLWEIEDVYFQERACLVLTDLNANGLDDVLAIGQDARLRALDGTNGAEIWLSPILGDGLIGPPVVTDLNADHLKDIVIANQAGQIHLGYSYINDIDWKTVETGLKISAVASAADLDDDGASEAFVGTDEGKLLIIDGKEGKLSTTYGFDEQIGKATGSSHFQEQKIRYPVTSLDLNGNQVTDIIIGATNGNYIALEGNILTRIWHESLSAVKEESENWLGAATGHFDNDHLQDAVIISNTLLKVMSGTDDPRNRNRVKWEHRLDGDVFFGPVSIADFNKDQISDVAVSTQSGAIHIFDGRNGEIFSTLSNQSNPAISPLLIADIGADNMLDILVVRRDRNLYRIQTNSPISKGGVVWGQAYSDENNSGGYHYTPPDTSLYNVMAGCAGLFFCVVGGVTFAAKKSRQQMMARNRKS